MIEFIANVIRTANPVMEYVVAFAGICFLSQFIYCPDKPGWKRFLKWCKNFCLFLFVWNIFVKQLVFSAYVVDLRFSDSPWYPVLCALFK